MGLCWKFEEREAVQKPSCEGERKEVRETHGVTRNSKGTFEFSNHKFVRVSVFSCVPFSSKFWCRSVWSKCRESMKKMWS